jgi:hypothetical protein
LTLAAYILLAIGIFSLMLLPMPLYSLLHADKSPGVYLFLYMLLGVAITAIVGGWGLHRRLRELPVTRVSNVPGAQKYAKLSGKQLYDTLSKDAATRGVMVNLQKRAGRWASRRLVLSTCGLNLSGEFLFQQETGVDRLAKWTGLSKEHQTGDRTFDDTVYTMSELPEGMVMALKHPEVREAVMELLRTGFEYIGYTEGTLWAAAPHKERALFRSKLNLEPAEQTLVVWGKEQLARLHDLLKELSPDVNGQLSRQPSEQAPSFNGAALPRSVERELKRIKPGFILKRKLLLRTPAVLSLPCLIYLLVVDRLLGNPHPLLDDQGLAFSVLITGSVLLMLWLGLAVPVLSGRSRSHKELGIGLITAAFVFPFVAFALLDWTNITLDQSPIGHYPVLITHKEKSWDSVVGTRYQVWYQGPREQEPRKIHLPKTLWERLEPKRHASFRFQSGYWGWPWLEGLDKPGVYILPPAVH